MNQTPLQKKHKLTKKFDKISLHSFKKIGRILLIFSLTIFLTLTSSLVIIAQTSTPSEIPPEKSETVKENQIDGIPVVLDGKTLFTVRNGFGSFSAQDRANVITKRIQEIAQDSSLDVANLKIVPPSTGSNLTFLALGDFVILTITPEDAESYRIPEDQLIQETFERIKTAIQEYRKERNPAYLLKSGIYTGVATLVLLLITFLILRLSGKVFPLIKNAIESSIPGIRIQNFEIISSHRISIFALGILQTIRFFILLIIFYLYVSFILSLFPWTKTFGNSILSYLIQSLELIFNKITQYLPNVFILVLIIGITYYLLKSIKPFFTAIKTENLIIPGFYPDWAQPTYRLLLILTIALATVIAFPYLPGFNSPAFRGISVFLGILFSIGSTSAVANVVGGIVLIYTRAFQLGDRIQIGDVIGEVIEKTLLVTRILTATNQIITIPNSSLLNSNVINFSVSSRELNRYLVLQTTVTLGYDVPWRKVHQTLIEAGLLTQNIKKEPSPFILQTSLDDFYVSYQLNIYTDKPNLTLKIYSELHQNIQDKCNEVGIEILSPHYSAIRDGNLTTIPENYLPKDYQSPEFLVNLRQKSSIDKELP